MNFVRIGSFVINLDAIAYWEEITVAGSATAITGRGGSSQGSFPVSSILRIHFVSGAEPLELGASLAEPFLNFAAKHVHIANA